MDPRRLGRRSAGRPAEIDGGPLGLHPFRSVDGLDEANDWSFSRTDRIRFGLLSEIDPEGRNPANRRGVIEAYINPLIPGTSIVYARGGVTPLQVVDGFVEADTLLQDDDRPVPVRLVAFQVFRSPLSVLTGFRSQTRTPRPDALLIEEYAP